MSIIRPGQRQLTTLARPLPDLPGIVSARRVASAVRVARQAVAW
ncbi:hypothetical protein AB0J47_42110 [Nocardia sp. NPDC049737]